MAKNSFAYRPGTLKEYRPQFNFLQSDLKDADSATKRDYYKAFYKSIAKAADQRLIELERLSKKEGYKEVTQWAYRQAQRDIKEMFGEDAKRFNRKIPDNLNTIYKDINRVLNFLESPSSSKKGIDEVYNKRANTIKDRYGVDVTWSNVGDLFSSALYEKVSKKYGSKTALVAIGVIQANDKKIKRYLGKKPISIHIAEDDLPANTAASTSVVEETANKFLRYYKTDVKSLLKKL